MITHAPVIAISASNAFAIVVLPPDRRQSGYSAPIQPVRRAIELTVLDQSVAESSGTQQESAQNDKPNGARRKWRLAIAAAVVLVVGVIGLLWWLHARHFENTDDAYIDGDITNVAPRAAGQVTQVLVVDNQWVRAGELLVQVDDSIAQTQLASGEAARAPGPISNR